ncbi:MAG: glucuronate isomerase, partial [Clostridia bacterium]|nr:glucuronate isomerase [Clostridia bacterium]
MQDIFLPSTLIYDCEFNINALRENKPYRNIGQLLISMKSVRNALRLCGAEERILDGNASDYECFAATCSSMEYLVGHNVYNGVKRLLEDVFGVYEQLSPFNCEELWVVLNS